MTGLAAGCVAWALVVAGQAAGAEGTPVIDISGAGFQAMPIAVPSVKVLKGGVPGSDSNPLAQDGTADAAAALSRVIRDDLALAGVFRVLDPAAYLPNAQKEGLVTGTFNMADWINIGASALVKVGLSRDVATGKSTLEGHLFDVARGRELLRMEYSGPAEAERRMAHRIADDVFNHFTKEPGVFRTRIAAVRQLKGKKDLFVMDMDGAGGRALNLPDAINLLPAWDRDGQSLLFTSYWKGTPDLYRVPVAGGTPTRLSGRQGLNSGGVVSPDGRFIAITLSKDGNTEIYLLDRDGNEVKRLTQDPQIDTSPSWSPDGRRLAFVSSRGGTPQIYVMEVEGGDKTARRLTFQGNYNQTPDWSPRGDKIAFTARDERNVFDVFVVDVNAGRIERLTQDQGNNEEPSWAPNGRMIAFTSTRSGASQVYLMNPDGSVQKPITHDRNNYSMPSWGPLPRD